MGNRAAAVKGGQEAGDLHYKPGVFAGQVEAGGDGRFALGVVGC